MLLSHSRLLHVLCLLSWLMGLTPIGAHTHGDVQLKSHSWSFLHFLGTFDRGELQRGFQVYKEVCSACHGLKRVAYRNLAALGYSKAEIKAFAALAEVTDGPDDEGKMFQRPGLPKDHLLSLFANDNAARAANGGALPPDLSLIIKARLSGPAYVYSLLTGYVTAPKTVTVEPGRYYNVAFPGNLLAMPPPLHEGQVTFFDGTKATVDQMAHDVVAFLAWAAEPELEQRRQLGVKVFLYLVFLTSVLYALKRKIWAQIS